MFYLSTELEKYLRHYAIFLEELTTLFIITLHLNSCVSNDLEKLMNFNLVRRPNLKPIRDIISFQTQFI